MNPLINERRFTAQRDTALKLFNELSERDRALMFSCVQHLRRYGREKYEDYFERQIVPLRPFSPRDKLGITEWKGICRALLFTQATLPIARTQAYSSVGLVRIVKTCGLLEVAFSSSINWADVVYWEKYQ